jgi:hypothetical protein
VPGRGKCEEDKRIRSEEDKNSAFGRRMVDGG